jgi:hypothetical protein
VTPSSIWPHQSAATPSPRGPEPSASPAAHASIHKQSECEVTPGHICRVPRDHTKQRPNDPLRELSGLLSRIPKDGSENFPRPGIAMNRENGIVVKTMRKVSAPLPKLSSHGISGSRNRIFLPSIPAFPTRRTTRQARPEVWAKPLVSTQFMRPDRPISIDETGSGHSPQPYSWFSTVLARGATSPCAV